MIILAQEESRRLKHNYVGTEQILLGLLGEQTSDAAKSLKSMGISLEHARKEVERIVGIGGELQLSAKMPFTPRTKRVLELAWDEAKQLQHNYISTEHILLGLIREGEGVACKVLQILGADLTCIRSHILELISSKEDGQKAPIGWLYSGMYKNDYAVGLDPNEKHSGTRSAYLKCIAKQPVHPADLSSWFTPEDYLEKRLRMTAWVKTELSEGRAQLWLLVEGDWKPAPRRPGSFDDMADRPIVGATDWQKYELVTDVPLVSKKIVYGLKLKGTGQVWLDDVSFEVVSKEIPLTGKYVGELIEKTGPKNLSFEED